MAPTRPATSSRSYQKSTLIFNRLLEPKLSQTGPHLATKILPKSIQKLIDFLIDFSMPFVSQNYPQNESQDDKKSLKNQFKTASGLKNVIF